MKTTKPDCIFCKIANGEIPTHVVYEDDVVMAFLDTSQITKGHTLVVPKYHLDNIFDYEADDAAAIFQRLPKIAQAMQRAFPDMQGVNILNNNGEVAFQSVFHTHIHLIPRYTNKDGFGLKWIPAKEGTYSDDVLETIAQTVHAEIKED
ncbi:MAG: HIT family protein [Aerococcus sp.]|nr:HIT family protein [Aerococcus sp.]